MRWSWWCSRTHHIHLRNLGGQMIDHAIGFAGRDSMLRWKSVARLATHIMHKKQILEHISFFVFLFCMRALRWSLKRGYSFLTWHINHYVLWSTRQPLIFMNKFGVFGHVHKNSASHRPVYVYPWMKRLDKNYFKRPAINVHCYPPFSRMIPWR